ncbi:rhodanese-like domain-containing protein [Flavobacterium sp. 7A]|uniref:rhodanese-like domain-containing protein n=1 Tax=Flavobacterium sp. 7A TaxID=2940571 RepID=UPI002227A7BF|nr:rhodanese-like domain-containing protein [Flavobacterium sp. 7A]MCW2120201.1 rhodanese-related sulfurtransferase [Flavobacterium sp. 7A]
MKFRIFLFTVTLFTLISCQKQQAQNRVPVEPTLFAEKILSTNNPQIVDVRTPEEFDNEHLINATNIDWKGNTFESEAEQLDKTKPVFVYCKSGARSKKAATKLKDLGFTDIYELQGGFMQWSAEGLKSNKN